MSPDGVVELNLGEIIAAIGTKFPERKAILQKSRTLSYGEFLDRSRRLASMLGDHGLGCFADRSQLSGHEVGQHLMAQYLHNGPEYAEGLFGSYLGRVAPFNVNYRYRADELRYLLNDAKPAAIQYHAAFAPVLAEVLADVPSVKLLLQVDDGSGNALLPGARDYDSALESASPGNVQAVSPDDLYVIYTGGTTGMPKGVLWRQGDVAVGTLGLLNRAENREWSSTEELLAGIRGEPRRLMPCAPMMHGAAQWAVLKTLCEGDTVVFPQNGDSFSAPDLVRAVQRHRVSVITMVGDAFGIPLINELERNSHGASSLRAIVSGGAALHVGNKQRLHQLIPRLRIVENIGSSESGIMGRRRSADEETAADRTFEPDEFTMVVDEDLAHVLEPGHQGSGWLARSGRIPLGYLGDAAKTQRTFPVVGGTRVTIPGDRARLRHDGQVELLGRDSLTINSGGEKVFVEEVEAVIKDHPAVGDAVVCGRPSERWGSEVAALVVATGSIDECGLITFCHSRIARYKAPRSVQFVDHIVRLATGKPDYAWAARTVRQPPDKPENDSYRGESH